MIRKKNQQKISVSDNVTSATDYAQTLDHLKQHIEQAQVRAIVSANKELIMLYWSIGKILVEKQLTNQWGTNVIETLAKDLQNVLRTYLRSGLCTCFCKKELDST